MSQTKRQRLNAQRRKQAKAEALAQIRARRSRRRRLIGLGLLGALAVAGSIAVWEATHRPDEPRALSPIVPDAALAEDRDWNLTIETNRGTIEAVLDGSAAPQAVAVFASLAAQGLYDNTDCHAVSLEDPYVLECGDPTGLGTGGTVYSYGPVENAPSGDTYTAGSIVMARDADDDYSMSSRFMIVYGDSTLISQDGEGYTVLGTVTQGLDIVSEVAKGGTITGALEGRPAQSLIVTKVTTS